MITFKQFLNEYKVHDYMKVPGRGKPLEVYRVSTITTTLQLLKRYRELRGFVRHSNKSEIDLWNSYEATHDDYRRQFKPGSGYEVIVSPIGDELYMIEIPVKDVSNIPIIAKLLSFHKFC